MNGRKRVFPVMSIRIPILLCLIFATLIPLVLQERALSGYYRQNLIREDMMEAQNRCLILANEMSGSGYLDNINDTSQTSAVNAEINTIADFFGGRIVVVNSDFRIVRDTFQLSQGKTIVVGEVLRAFGGQPQTHLNEKKDYYYVAYPIQPKQAQNAAAAAGAQTQPAVKGVLLLTVSTEKISQTQKDISGEMQVLELILMLGMFVADAAAAALILRPVRKLVRQLRQSSEGNLDEKIDVVSYRETRDISNAVNSTVRQLRAIDESRQEFVSNVSHELKTPITSIRVLADSLMGMDHPPAEMYREFMEDISNEVDREAKIIDDLLTLVRMDRKSPDMNITANASINLLIADILKKLKPIARQKNIELIYESVREVRADVDEMKLSLALMNLVENAIKYNREEGKVHVTLDADHRMFYVKIEDNGIGIPEEEQKHVFEKFYRVDKARSRETGGTGLGLAITKNIIVLHHGAIRLQSAEGEGSTFTVRIPLRYVP